MSQIAPRSKIWRVHFTILLGSPNIVKKGIPERSLGQFGTPQSTPKPSYIFICQVVKFTSSFSYLLKPSDHLLKVDAEAENLANNDMPTAAQFDVKLALDVEIVKIINIDYHNIIDII